MCAALIINDAPWPGTGRQLTPGMVGDWYETTLSATGGSGGYTWAFSSPELAPARLAIDPGSGKISGIPVTEAQGTSAVSVQVTDSSGQTAPQTFTLTVNAALRIADGVAQLGPHQIKLQADGGAGPPYRWETIAGTAVPWAQLNADDGTIQIDEHAPKAKARVSIRVRDAATPPHTDDTSLILKVRPAGMVRRDRRLATVASVLTLGARRSLAFRVFGHTTFWLSLIALWVPLAGTVPIVFYSFTSTGPHSKYLAVGLLTAIAALVSGCLIGFLFGLPQLSSSSGQQNGRYSPSPNLPEVSDWLTKLLLGAGLVQLTHLGAPVGALIDHVASGMYVVKTYEGSAKVMAGALLIGYTGIGVLTGYVITASWYLKRLNTSKY
jgi:hypothetical protein